MILYIASIAFLLWIIFFNGAKRIENTLLGYFEYGREAENANYIRIFAWACLTLLVGLLFVELIG